MKVAKDGLDLLLSLIEIIEDGDEEKLCELCELFGSIERREITVEQVIEIYNNYRN